MRLCDILFDCTQDNLIVPLVDYSIETRKENSMPTKQPGEPYQRVTLEEAASMIQSGSGVIDGRRPDEYATGHVADSISIPVDDILARLSELPEDGDLLFICAAGARSGLACEMAAAMGIAEDRLYNIYAGTPSWIEAGLPTEY